MFKEVKLSRAMGCVPYAMARIGNTLGLTTYEDVIECDKAVILPYSKDAVKTGDIVIWDKDMCEKDIPYLLTESGVFVTKRRLARYHFGVVEKDDMVSDFVLDTADFVRFSLLDDFKPTKILRFTTG